MRSALPIGVFSSGGHEKASTFFARMAHATAAWSGKPAAFLTAVAVVLVWAISGPIFHYSDTWQLVINTGTSLVTFLMVFLIQSSQNRDTEALQIKLDELIRAFKPADNSLLNLEDLEEGDLDTLRDEYRALAEKARRLKERAEKKQSRK
jgi:low affinity Fe/Cu permease